MPVFISHNMTYDTAKFKELKSTFENENIETGIRQIFRQLVGESAVFFGVGNENLVGQKDPLTIFTIFIRNISNTLGNYSIRS